MSDFLTRMAERSLGLASLVDASPPGLFASADGLPIPDAPSLDVANDTVRTQTANIVDPSDNSVRKQRLEMVDPPTDMAPVERSEGPVSPHLQAEKVSPARDAVATTRLVKQAEKENPAQTSDRRYSGAPERPVQPVPTPALSERHTAVPEVLVPQQPIPTALSATENRAPQEAHLEPRVPGLPAGRAADRALFAMPVQETPPAPDPDVRITIGRVEVRAEVPVRLAERPSRQPRTSPQPGPTLNEYLQRDRQGQ